jgi:hypothetical protein
VFALAALEKEDVVAFAIAELLDIEEPHAQEA